MAIELALMIEGQEGLTWDRWRRAGADRRGRRGTTSLFRSDHLTGLFGDVRPPSLDTWASLTWLATATTRLRFGPTRLPADLLPSRRCSPSAPPPSPSSSGGRLDLGIGAGWHEGEHAMFGIPLPAAEGAPRPARVRRAGHPRAVAGPTRHAGAAVLSAARGAVASRCRPAARCRSSSAAAASAARSGVVAEHADEWNVTRVTIRRVRRPSAACWTPLPRRRSRPRHDPPLADGPHPRRPHRGRGGRPARPRARRLPAPARRTRRAGTRPGSSTARRTRSGAIWSAGQSRRHRTARMLQILDMTDLDMIRLIGRELAS